MKTLRSAWGFILVLALVANFSYAREDYVPSSRYTSARSAGMGDALMPFADDGSSALFFNPAGLPKLKNTDLEPINFFGSSNLGGLSYIGNNYAKASDLETMRSVMLSNPDKWIGYGGGIFPNFYTSGIAIGALYQSSYNGKYDTLSGKIRYVTRHELVPTAGIGASLFKGVMRVGYALHWVNTSYGDIEALIDEADPSYGKGLYEGSGFSHNAAMAITWPVIYLPQINIVARNILDLKYAGTSLNPVAEDSPGAPPTEKMTIDLSASTLFKIGGPSYINASAVWRDATNTSSTTPIARLGLGAELSFRDTIFMRCGYASNWGSAGFGFRTVVGELNFAWHSDELGTEEKPDRDIRYILQYKRRFF